MLKTEFKESTLFLSGSIDENSEFPTLELPKNIKVNCSGVTGINSVGVKSWIIFFTDLAQSGITASLVACPPCLVEQANLITNFLGGHKFESIMVPYICNDCDNEQLVEMSMDKIKELNLDPEDIPCSECSASAEFDELPEEYFHFLKRKSA